MDTTMEKNIITIDPGRDYALEEIIELRLIPGVTGYAKLYNLVTVKFKTPRPKGMGRRPAQATTRFNIKPNPDQAIGTHIHGKLTVKGVELIKFLVIHGLINK